MTPEAQSFEAAKARDLLKWAEGPRSRWSVSGPPFYQMGDPTWPPRNVFWWFYHRSYRATLKQAFRLWKRMGAQPWSRLPS